MSSIESPSSPIAEDQEALLDVADASLDSGLRTGQPLKVDSDEYYARLQEQRATFVTLRIAGELRGCMGSLTASVSLVKNVSKNAFLAGFRDPRFSGLTGSEFAKLELGISILSQLEPFEFDSEADLISKMQPGIDGLILKEENHSGTLLPAVWSHVNGPADFLRQLKRKAGLPADYWSSTIQVKRYTAESFRRNKLQASR